MNLDRIERGRALRKIAFAGALFIGAATWLMPGAITPPTLRKPAPDFALQDNTGAALKLSSYKGKVVLLNFWATWCGGCKEEMPWFMEFENKYKSSGLTIIGVSMDEEGWKIVKPFLQTHPLNYPVVVGTEDLAKKYNAVEALPVSALIDRNGRIAAAYTGKVDKINCENEIKTLLAK